MHQHFRSNHKESRDPKIWDAMVKDLTVHRHSLLVPKAVPHVHLVAVPKGHLELFVTQGLTREEAQERFTKALRTQTGALSPSDP